jgi:hypothetical protein
MAAGNAAQRSDRCGKLQKLNMRNFLEIMKLNSKRQNKLPRTDTSHTGHSVRYALCVPGCHCFCSSFVVCRFEDILWYIHNSETNRPMASHFFALAPNASKVKTYSACDLDTVIVSFDWVGKYLAGMSGTPGPISSGLLF